MKAPNLESSMRRTLVLLMAALCETAHAAGGGEPEAMTDHPWYPGELSCSTFERLFKTQAALYAGLSYAMMGMSMCEAAFDLQAQVGQTAMFALAEQRFTSAASRLGRRLAAPVTASVSM